MAAVDNIVEFFRVVIVILILGFVTLKIADSLYFGGALPLLF